MPSLKGNACMTTAQREIRGAKLAAHTKPDGRMNFLLSMLCVLVSLMLEAGVTERTCFQNNL